VAPVITGTTKHFMFHIRWIFILKFLYFNFFSDSFCIAFISDGIATSISKQILSLMFLIIVSGLFARTSLSVCIPRFHSAVISSCWHAALGIWEYQFSVVSMLNIFFLSNIDVYRLYHVLLHIHSLPEWDILMLGGQKFIVVIIILLLLLMSTNWNASSRSL
jgi:hypothetical protein